MIGDETGIKVRLTREEGPKTRKEFHKILFFFQNVSQVPSCCFLRKLKGIESPTQTSSTICHHLTSLNVFNAFEDQ